MSTPGTRHRRRRRRDHVGQGARRRRGRDRSSPAAGCPTACGARARHPAPRRQAGLAGRAAQGLRAGDRPAGRRGWPPLAGVAVASMVPSLTAVSRQGVPVLPGPPLRRPRGPGDRRRRLRPRLVARARCPTPRASCAGRPPRFPRPGATGPARPWPPTPSPASRPIDTGVTASLGALHTHGRWNTELLSSLGVAESQMPAVVPMGQAGRHAARERRRDHGRHDRCPVRPDRRRRDRAGRRAGDLRRHADRLGGVRRMAAWYRASSASRTPRQTASSSAGPSNAGALFVDWARHLLRGTPRPGPDRERLEPRLGEPGPGARSGCPTCGASARPSRTTRCARTSTGSTSDRAPRRSSAPPTRRAGSWSGGCSTARGVKATRIVASGGGSRVTAWMAAVADATNLPVDTVAVPEGAALGAAYFARMAAGLETSLDDSVRWSAVGPAHRARPGLGARRRGALRALQRPGHREPGGHGRRLAARPTRWA